MSAGFAFALLFLSLDAAVSVHLEAPPKVFEAVKSGLLRERPALAFAEDDAQAALSLKIDRRQDVWFLAVSSSAHSIEERSLGSATDAAIRLAVLISLRRIQELENLPVPAVIVTATVSATVSATVAAELAPKIVVRREPVTSVVPTSTPSPPQARLVIEASAFLISWTVPFTVRPGLTAAAFYRVEPFALGLRAEGAGVCCTIKGDNVDVDAAFAALFAEGRFRFDFGEERAGVELAIAIGPTLDSIVARGKGVEADINLAEETKTFFGFGGRAGAFFDFAISDALAIDAGTGVHGFAQDFRVRLPDAIPGEHVPARRGQVLFFAELGVRSLYF